MGRVLGTPPHALPCHMLILMKYNVYCISMENAKLSTQI